jgi:hypothetical protein
MSSSKPLEAKPEWRKLAHMNFRLGGNVDTTWIPTWKIT